MAPTQGQPARSSARRRREERNFNAVKDMPSKLSTEVLTEEAPVSTTQGGDANNSTLTAQGGNVNNPETAQRGSEEDAPVSASPSPATTQGGAGKVEVDRPVIDPEHPFANADEVLNENLPLQVRVKFLDEFEEAVKRLRDAWREKRRPVCAGCGAKHPPPCLGKEGAEKFRSFKEQCQEVRSKWAEEQDAKDPAQSSKAQGKKTAIDHAVSSKKTDGKKDVENLAPPSKKGKGKATQDPAQPTEAEGKKSRGVCKNCARPHKGGAAACQAPVCQRGGCRFSHYPSEPCREARRRFIEADLLNEDAPGGALYDRDGKMTDRLATNVALLVTLLPPDSMAQVLARLHKRKAEAEASAEANTRKPKKAKGNDHKSNSSSSNRRKDDEDQGRGRSKSRRGDHSVYGRR
ncbi:hypothetical protein CC80DRAFT_551897 [Byssothecium circinans]|uniref:Uncharacterized protein n=1 Tax=Byssothecium circinans TaxID=147558 RepID=A0A6A5TME2_9PLEO|nr:hypothetical protein CC80DRAFT_551897 [Byssothecium circinans]